MGQPFWLFPLLSRICSWSWKHLEVSILVLQTWRRFLSDSVYSHAFCCWTSTLLHGVGPWPVCWNWSLQVVHEADASCWRNRLGHGHHLCHHHHLLQHDNCLDSLLSLLWFHISASLVSLWHQQLQSLLLYFPEWELLVINEQNSSVLQFNLYQFSWYLWTGWRKLIQLNTLQVEWKLY